MKHTVKSLRFTVSVVGSGSGSGSISSTLRFRLLRVEMTLLLRDREPRRTFSTGPLLRLLFLLCRLRFLS